MSTPRIHKLPKASTAKELESELRKLTTALQQERADAINLRRRHEAEINGLRAQSKASVVRELLPVIDNFERAFKHVPKTANTQPAPQINDWTKGVISIKMQFDKTLETMGVERIKTVGEVFDPHLHEAVSMEPGEGKQEVITEELQPGYQLGDNVIRHAIVRVKLQ